MKPLTIVIVDDESLARQGLRHHLREIEGVEIIAEFGDSQRALNYLQTARPDLLLVDIEMPGMTGMVLHTLHKKHLLLIEWEISGYY